MGANDHRGRAIFDPRGMIGRIHVGLHMLLQMLHTKCERFGSCGFRAVAMKTRVLIRPASKPNACNPSQ